MSESSIDRLMGEMVGKLESIETLLQSHIKRVDELNKDMESLKVRFAYAAGGFAASMACFGFGVGVLHYFTGG